MLKYSSFEMTIKWCKSRGAEERPPAQMIQRLLVCRRRAASCLVSAGSRTRTESRPLIQVQPGSSGQFTNDSNEGGVLVLESLVVCTEVPQNLESRADRK